MIYGIAAAHAANGLSASDAYAESEDSVGANVLDLGEVEAVFVAEGEMGEKVFESVDAAFGKEFGTLRADTFDHLDVGLQAVGHRDVYIISVVEASVEGKAKRRFVTESRRRGVERKQEKEKPRKRCYTENTERRTRGARRIRGVSGGGAGRGSFRCGHILRR